MVCLTSGAQTEESKPNDPYFAPFHPLKAPPPMRHFLKPQDRLAIEFLYAGQGIGRPFVAPPDMPADRVKMVRDAFDANQSGGVVRMDYDLRIYHGRFVPNHHNWRPPA